jgi:predicted DNA-binding protein
MNIAEIIMSRYDSDDFKSDYAANLSESFHNNEGDILNILYSLFNVANHETGEYFDFDLFVEKETIQKVYDYIKENIEEFIEDFSGYYVGYTSLASVSFGEQEEQLTGLSNHRTGKDYTLPYLKKAFDEAGYVIHGDYAYMVADGGLHVDLCNCKDEINEILNK